MNFDDMIDDMLDKTARKSFDYAKTWLQENPDIDVPPYLEAYTWDSNGVECHHYNFAMAVDARFDVARMAGEEMGQRGDKVVVTVTAMCGWKAKYTEEEAKREDRVQPRDRPDKVEILMVIGQSLTHKYINLIAEIDRSDGQVTFGETEEITEGASDLLDNFWYRYAVASLAEGTQLLN